MALKRLELNTTGERFYPMTELVTSELNKSHITEGIVHLFCMHTSCGLTINESFDHSAKEDLESYLKHVAPRDLSFIKHDAEGPDDSPSHMKTLLTGQNLAIPFENGELALGTWQGIYLCEFRDEPKRRVIIMKVIEG